MYFAVGLVLGIIVGASFVWWLQNYDFKVWFTFSGKNSDENIIKLETSTKDSLKILYKDIKKAVNKHYDYSKKDNNSDTVATISNIDDTLNIKSKTSLLSNSDDIVVAKDELLYVRNIKIDGVTNKTVKNLDSLLINDKTAKSNNLLKVEFWRSPINYRGYLLTDNKLILYGIYIYEDVSLEIRNNKLYMFYQNNHFLLDKNDDFQPFLSSKLPPKK